jgi:hypothetical protein
MCKDKQKMEKEGKTNEEIKLHVPWPLKRPIPFNRWCFDLMEVL